MSDSIKAHGLNGALVDPDWPPLTPPEVRSVLAEFDSVAGPFEIVSVSPRPFSAASVVATRDRRVFLKRHAKLIRTAEALHEEHRFMAHLRKSGVCVPEVFSTRNGDTVVESDSSVYELHSIPPGIDLYGDAISWTPFFSTAHARSAGVMLGKLHVAAESYDAPSRAERPLVASFTIFASTDPEKSWDEYVRRRPALESYLTCTNLRERAFELLSPFYKELRPMLPFLKSLWTHNDLHASNLFWSNATKDAQATAVIDFGLCDRTNAVHDLAQALERNVVEWLTLMQHPDRGDAVRVHADHLWALLEGYESVRVLSSEERAALPPMLALCHAEFALSEADYFLTALRSEEKARVACEDYLIGHADWWRTEGGWLLDALRAWSRATEHREGARVRG